MVVINRSCGQILIGTVKEYDLDYKYGNVGKNFGKNFGKIVGKYLGNVDWDL